MQRSVLIVSLLLLGAACASPPGGDGGRIEHERFGVRADLAGWEVYTEADSAPPMLRAALARKRGPDDAPWFLALRGDELLTVGAQLSDQVVEPGDFLRRMQAQLGAGSRITNARRLPGGDLLFEVHAPALATALHYLLHADHGRVLHVTLAGAGTLPPLEHFAAALSRFEVRRGAGWVAPWTSADPLEGEPLEGWTSAQPEPPHGFEPVACGEGEHPLLWSAATGSGRLSLFGSIHFGHPSFYPLAPPIEEAFADAERLVVEMDLSAREQELAAAFTQEGGAGDARPLSEQLDPELHAELREALDGLGVPADALEGVSPGLVGTYLSSLAFTRRGFDAQAGVDLYFLRRAADKEIVELESAEQQAQLIGDFDEEFLRMALDSLERADAEVDALHAAWRCGDEAGLVQVLMARDAVASPEERAWLESWLEATIYRRNEQMAERIAELFAADGDTFVVVGAAHLVGERGIPALLRAAGYPVERVGP